MNKTKSGLNTSTSVNNIQDVSQVHSELSAATNSKFHTAGEGAVEFKNGNMANPILNGFFEAPDVPNDDAIDDTLASLAIDAATAVPSSKYNCTALRENNSHIKDTTKELSSASMYSLSNFGLIYQAIAEDIEFCNSKLYSASASINSNDYTDTLDTRINRLVNSSISRGSVTSRSLARDARQIKDLILAQTNDTNPFYSMRVSEVYDRLLDYLTFINRSVATVKNVSYALQLKDYLRAEMRDYYLDVYNELYTAEFVTKLNEVLSKAKASLLGMFYKPDMLNDYLKYCTLGFTPSQRGSAKLVIPFSTADMTYKHIANYEPMSGVSSIEAHAGSYYTDLSNPQYEYFLAINLFPCIDNVANKATLIANCQERILTALRNITIRGYDADIAIINTGLASFNIFPQLNMIDDSAVMVKNELVRMINKQSISAHGIFLHSYKCGLGAASSVDSGNISMGATATSATAFDSMMPYDTQADVGYTDGVSAPYIGGTIYASLYNGNPGNNCVYSILNNTSTYSSDAEQKIFPGLHTTRGYSDTTQVSKLDTYNVPFFSKHGYRTNMEFTSTTLGGDVTITINDVNNVVSNHANASNICGVVRFYTVAMPVSGGTGYVRYCNKALALPTGANELYEPRHHYYNGASLNTALGYIDTSSLNYDVDAYYEKKAGYQLNANMVSCLASTIVPVGLPIFKFCNILDSRADVPTDADGVRIVYRGSLATSYVGRTVNANNTRAQLFFTTGVLPSFINIITVGDPTVGETDISYAKYALNADVDHTRTIRIYTGVGLGYEDKYYCYLVSYDVNDVGGINPYSDAFACVARDIDYRDMATKYTMKTVI